MLALDHLVDLDEGRAEPLRQRGAEGRFAGAAQSDQSDAPVPRRAVRYRKMRIEQGMGLAEPSFRQAPQQLDDRPQSGRHLGLSGDEPGKRQVQRVTNPAQQFDRNIALAGFQLREIALRKTGIAGEGLSRHAPASPLLADPFAETAQVVLRSGGRGTAQRFHFGTQPAAGA